MAIKVTWLNPGDVVKVDGSWCIRSPVHDDVKMLRVQQSIRQVEDKASPQEMWEEGGARRTYYPVDYFVDYTGPAVSDTVSLSRKTYGFPPADVSGNAGDKKSIFDDYVPLAEVLAKKGISIMGKHFLVVAARPENERYPDQQIVTARELTTDNKIDPDGVMVVFNQRTEFIGSPYHVHQANIVGRMEPTFAPFKPV